MACHHMFVVHVLSVNCQSDEHWNCFKLKGSVGNTSERQDGVHIYVGFSERIETTLN